MNLFVKGTYRLSGDFDSHENHPGPDLACLQTLGKRSVQIKDFDSHEDTPGPGLAWSDKISLQSQTALAWKTQCNLEDGHAAQ